MRFDKPAILALTISVVLGIVVLSSGVLINYLTIATIKWQEILVIGSFATVVSFFLVRYSVNRFIYSKVKIIYKNIHDLKVGNEGNEEDPVNSTDLDQVTREVTEWAEQRKNEIQELQDRERFRREFIGNISHELKTPIFNIQGYLLTLLDGAMEDKEINRKYLKRANKSVDRMINILDDMEVISKLESNRMNIDYSVFDIVQLVKDVFELMEDKAKGTKARLKLKKDNDNPLRVEADRQKIEQVLINLVANAIKYGRSKKGTVEVRFFDMHQNILVEVADDGLGIPQEDIPRIFERFYRVDKSRSREAGGTGLGLSIVKHIMEAHKQSISVRSSEKAGSTFSFTLKKAK